MLTGSQELFDFPYEFIRGTHMEGMVVGGNLRCLLKLAGTPYWPDMRDKILLLEAYGGKIPQMVTALSQLSQLGVLRKSAESSLEPYCMEQGTAAGHVSADSGIR